MATLLHSDMMADVRFALRRARRSPLFAVIVAFSTVVSTIALATTFNIVYTADHKGPPYPELERLAVVYTRHDRASSAPGSEGPGYSYQAFTTLRASSRAFDGLEGIADVVKRDVIDGVAGDRVVGHAGSPGLLPMLSVQMASGRWISPQDTMPGAEPVIVLSHEYWLKRFGGEPDVVSRRATLQLEDAFPRNAVAKTYRIVGILPASFTWDQTSTFWVPLGSVEPQSLSSVSPVGRLRDNVPLRSADTEVEALGNAMGDVLEQSRPPGDKSLGGRIEAHAAELRTYFHDRVGGANARLALLGIALCVLILATANIAFLNLLRAQARRAEFAVRSALGASRRRLARQILLEVSVTALPGVAIGLIASPSLIRVAGSKLNIAALGIVPAMDSMTIVVSIAAALLSVIAVSVIPVTVYAAREIIDGTAGRVGSTYSRSIAAPNRVFVTIETAMALVVLTSAGLAIRALARLEFRELGYSPTHVYELTPPISRPRPAPEVIARATLALQQLAHVPDVSKAGIVASDFTVQLRADQSTDPLPPTVPRSVLAVTPNLISLLSMHLEAGRWLSDADDVSSPNVVVISSEAAHRLFPAVSPVGHRVALTGMGPGEVPVWATIVGVVQDNHLGHDPMDKRMAVVYRPFAQARPFLVQFLVNVHRVTQSTYPALRRGASEAANAPPSAWKIVSLEEAVSTALATPRFAAASLTTMASISLALALVGIFGMTALMVAGRTREIAIRVALGAQQSQLLVAVLRSVAGLTLAGVAIGVALSLASGRILQGLLHGDTPYDPTVYVIASTCLVLCALSACLLPARRALRIDPAGVLRAD